MKFLHALAISVAAIAGTAQAGTPVLGFEIGVSTIDQVKSALSGRSKINSGGLNRYSSGPMFTTDGDSYGIEGLNGVTYVFDGDNRLAAVFMEMSNHRFESVLNALSGKYKASAKQIPFVGDKYVRFKTQDAEIAINSPHMSFDMNVSYVRDDLMRKAKTQTAVEAEGKRKREAAQF